MSKKTLTEENLAAILLLGSYGFSAKFIEKHMWHYYRCRITTGYIYVILSQNETQLGRFRNGESAEAQTVLVSLNKVKTMLRKVG